LIIFWSYNPKILELIACITTNFYLHLSLPIIDSIWTLFEEEEKDKKEDNIYVFEKLLISTHDVQLEDQTEIVSDLQTEEIFLIPLHQEDADKT
jgi:hypothetical protein